LQALSVLRDLKVATKMHSQRWDCQGFTGLGLFWWLLSPLLAALPVRSAYFFRKFFGAYALLSVAVSPYPALYFAPGLLFLLTIPKSEIRIKTSLKKEVIQSNEQ
jgi:hypothetical protein